VLIAAVHLHPLITVPLATIVLGWIVWYWIRLGRARVPTIRRKLRRVSLGVVAILLPLLVTAMSFLDPAQHQREYIFAWTSAMLLVAILLMFAGLDALNTMRIVQQQTHDELREAAGNLAEAIKARKESLLASSQHQPGKNGASKS
jgi:hypothetical protein